MEMRREREKNCFVLALSYCVERIHPRRLRRKSDFGYERKQHAMGGVERGGIRGD